MAAIRGKNTKPELVVRRFLHNSGLRYSLHRKDLIGKPDLVFPIRNHVLFVHGCFWHGHKNCKNFRIPKTRSDWWEEKIERTVERDGTSKSALRQAGWLVSVIWECQLSEENLRELSQSIKAGKEFLK